MLEHLNDPPTAPSRVVVMGAGGFVGAAACKRLEAEGIEVLGLTRREVDLLAEGADERLAARLRGDDAVVMVSALAPCKTNDMLIDNLRMMGNVCAAVAAVPLRQLVYISSDAVYADKPIPLSERSPTAPETLHGVMHLAREVMLRAAIAETPLAVLRPSLLYGAADPHNGYGPNRFRRAAAEGSDIVLFGEGEERRDHVLIDDLAEVIRLVLYHRSAGVLNVACGEVASFRDVAELVASHFDPPPAIKGSPRRGPMPHDGYRPFDIGACREAFPAFRYTPLAEGLAKVHAAATK